jgi:hypothetical protein
LWRGEKKGTKGISHKLAYDLSPAIRTQKKKMRMKRRRGWKRDSVCVCVLVQSQTQSVHVQALEQKKNKKNFKKYI